jgi:hypothetical protein
MLSCIKEKIEVVHFSDLLECTAFIEGAPGGCDPSLAEASRLTQNYPDPRGFSFLSAGTIFSGILSNSWTPDLIPDKDSIRFVMDSPRRSRNRAACRRCQRRKIRCDGDLPRCASCRKANVVCVNDGKQEVNRTCVLPSAEVVCGTNSCLATSQICRSGYNG